MQITDSIGHEPTYTNLPIFLNDELLASLGIEKMDPFHNDTTVSTYQSVQMLDVVRKSGATWNKC